MNKKLRLVLLVAVFSVLAACNREAQPSVSPVGPWQGTLTTLTGGSGTQPFTATAEVTKLEAEDAGYAGVFTVDDEVYSVTGYYNGTNDEGDIFIFEIPLEELWPTVSPVEFFGMIRSGPMIEDVYSGRWLFNSDASRYSPAGELSLERLS